MDLRISARVSLTPRRKLPRLPSARTHVPSLAESAGGSAVNHREPVRLRKPTSPPFRVDARSKPRRICRRQRRRPLRAERLRVSRSPFRKDARSKPRRICRSQRRRPLRADTATKSPRLPPSARTHVPSLAESAGVSAVDHCEPVRLRVSRPPFRKDARSKPRRICRRQRRRPSRTGTATKARASLPRGRAFQASPNLPEA